MSKKRNELVGPSAVLLAPTDVAEKLRELTERRPEPATTRELDALRRVGEAVERNDPEGTTTALGDLLGALSPPNTPSFRDSPLFREALKARVSARAPKLSEMMTAESVKEVLIGAPQRGGAVTSMFIDFGGPASEIASEEVEVGVWDEDVLGEVKRGS